MKLDNITLVAATGASKDVDKTIKALEFSCKNIVFKNVKLLCPQANNIKHEYIETFEIDELDRINYSKLMINDLHKYIDTDFCITIQYDGFVIDHKKWNNHFLNFDYIGAPWLGSNTYHFYNRVGNGGFSLRSKKFLLESKELEYQSDIQFTPVIPKEETITPEDWFMCCYKYKHMVQRGIKFADIFTAYNFSVEHPNNLNFHLEYKYYNPKILETYQSFGFHGEFNTAAMELLQNA